MIRLARWKHLLPCRSSSPTGCAALLALPSSSKTRGINTLKTSSVRACGSSQLKFKDGDTLGKHH